MSMFAPSIKRRRYGWAGVTALAGLIIVLMTYFPLIFVASNSLKTGESLSNGSVFALFTEFDTQNYVQAWHGIDMPLLNTVIVAIVAIVIGVTAAVLAAYAFAQFQFRGKSILFVAYISLLMIPSTLTIIPLFLMMKSVGLYGSWWALILPYAAGAQPLLVLLFRGFFEQIPHELLESARVDGAPEYSILLRIIAPLTRPIILTGAILMTVTVWGDYIWPEVVLSDYKKYTVSAGLQQYISGLGLTGTAAGSVFAAYVITMLPMFAFVGISMRYFVAGMTEGSVKI